MILIVVSDFNHPGSESVTRELEASAVAELQKQGETFEVFHVPGAVEIPVTIQRLIRKKKPEAVIALGSVVKGETDHYDFVLKSCIEGLTRVSLDESIPVIQGVIAAPSPKLALDRQHLGTQYAQTAITMKKLFHKI